ncbi:MAG: polysaccharide deacetylase family protein [Firmicutes bacterium]|nr:polysaccharide deacetylase family protein [Bacillota bacterium]
MLPDSFIVLSAIAFLMGLLNSAGIGQRLSSLKLSIDPRLLDALLVLVPITTAKVAVGSGMSVVLTGFSSLMSFQLAQWAKPKYGLQRYTPALLTLAFVSPFALLLIIGIWFLLYRWRCPQSLSLLATGLALLPILWVLHHRDLYVIFALACLVLILYNEAPYLVWDAPRFTMVDPSPSRIEPLPKKSVFLRRSISIGIVIVLAAFIFFNRYVYRGFGLQQELFRIGNRDLPFVALTFDDGPDRLYTPKILDILKEKEVPATFFLIGKHAEANPDIVQRIAAEGHEIGNHTYSHRNLYGLDEATTWREIGKADQVISDIIGSKIYLFRPPRGMYSPATIKFAHQLQYTTVLWSISSRDWAEVSTGSVERNILKNTTGGDILLFHDSGSIIGTSGGYRYNTVRALPAIIDGLRARGFHFVTVNQLMMIAGLTEGDDAILPDLLPEILPEVLPNLLDDSPFAKE